MIESRSETPNTRTQQIVRFKLTEALTAGGSAKAVFKFFRPGGSSYYSTKEEYVYDETGGRDGAIDDTGVAVWMPDANRYEILDKVCTP
jgi:hypothetical protein